jgi:sucrose-6-phosphate hydrolase SacC (GH32 family)
MFALTVTAMLPVPRDAAAQTPAAVVRKPAALPAMHWADDSSGRPFSKDPSVIHFGGRYLMYYSLPGAASGGMQGWSVGIAESRDLVDWKRIGTVGPAQDCDKKGLAAPAAWVHDGKVHLFYQTYGNGRKDAICHAWSTNGVDFIRHPENPIFAPTGDWTAGRAIDAEVFPIGEKLFLYFATRDPEMKTQMLGVASAPLNSDYSRKQWTQLVNGPILKPELLWERDCIEAASVVSHQGKLWMFYAGGYNNAPQQIGVAVSTNGIQWTRVANQPLVPNGPPGSWNSSESGHPGIFKDADGSFHLFYQGNNDTGKTWYLSKVKIAWQHGRPIVSE